MLLVHCAPLWPPDATATVSSLPSLEEAAFGLEVGEEMEMPMTLEAGQSKNPPKVLLRNHSHRTQPPAERLRIRSFS